MLTNYFSLLTIEQRTGGNDFTTVSWAAIAGNHRGFIQPVSGGEAFRDGKAGEQATHRMYTGLSTPAVYGYKVTQDGQDYVMLYAIQPAGISGVNRHKEIILGMFQ